MYSYYSCLPRKPAMKKKKKKKDWIWMKGVTTDILISPVWKASRCDGVTVHDNIIPCESEWQIMRPCDLGAFTPDILCSVAHCI